MKRLFAALLLSLVALAGPTSAQTQLVNSFETQNDLKTLSNWYVTTAVTTTQGVTDGAQALQATFRTGTQWPHLRMAAPAPWDWSSYGGLAIDVTNTSAAPIAFGVRVDDDPAANGVTHCRSGIGTVPAGATVTFVAQFTPGPDPSAYGMSALPPVYPNTVNLGWYGSGAFNLAHIIGFQLFVQQPAANETLILDNVRLMPAVNPAAFVTGIVDPYGQYTGADWPGKLHNPTDWGLRVNQEQAAIAAAPVLPGRDAFGGWSGGPAQTATGFFYTKQINGKWWLVDPLGNLFFSAGMDYVNVGEPTMVTGRESMFSWMPASTDPLYKYFGFTNQIARGPVSSGYAFNFYAANVERKYGSLAAVQQWQQTSLARMQAWGFNTLGNWSDWHLYGNGKVPYVVNTGVAGTFAHVSSGLDWWGQMPDPFDPRFAAAATLAFQGQPRLVKTDPYCLGYFVDNELSWAGNGSPTAVHYGLAYGALSADAAASPAKQAFVTQMQTRYTTIAKLNSAWGTSLASWSAFSAPFIAPAAPNAAQAADMSAFLLSFARQYFQTVRTAQKAWDANHLYLGCRFASWTPEAIQAAGENCDVVGINYYAARLGSDILNAVSALPKPVMIGEFHFGALDRGMFAAGLVNAGSQAGRAAMYQTYVRSVVDNPHFVGCHWFQYEDMPLTGRAFDGENFGVGFVDVTDTPYPEMVTAAKTVNAEMYTRRFGP